VRGHQLAEMRTMAGVTQAELAEALGVSQARISKIEHGEISGIDIVRAYVAALGGSIDMIARLGDRSWKGSLTRGRLFAQRHVLAKGAPSAGPAPGSAPALCR
jgi:transcriptional regulator with XRE-family HTH domain